MADAIWTVDRARISDVGCGLTRRTLLALEPGGRIWMTVDGTRVLLERVADDVAGNSVRRVAPADESRAAWLRLFADAEYPIQEIDFIERPADHGRSADRWCADEEVGA